MSKIIEKYEIGGVKGVVWEPDKVEANRDMLNVVKKIIEVLDGKTASICLHRVGDWDSYNNFYAHTYKETLDVLKEIDPGDCDRITLTFESGDSLVCNIYKHRFNTSESIYKRINPVIEKLGY